MKKLSLLIAASLCLLLVSPVKAGAEEDRVFLTTVMYHSILNSRRGVYIVSEAQLDADLAAYRAAGYAFVFPSEVIAYAEGKGALPEKPLMITFDDGHYNNLYYGLPLLIAHDAKAVINVIGKFSEFSTVSGDSDNPNYSHLTWDELRILCESGHFEIGSHTYGMHDYAPRYGADRKYGESDDDYRAALQADAARINEKIFGSTGKFPLAFAYPFGKYNKTAAEVYEALGYKMTMTCNEKISVLHRGRTEDLKFIGRYNRSGEYSTRFFLEKLAEGMKKAEARA